jgi:hypothetical protein
LIGTIILNLRIRKLEIEIVFDRLRDIRECGKGADRFDCGELRFYEHKFTYGENKKCEGRFDLSGLYLCVFAQK